LAKVRFERTTDWTAKRRVVFFGGNGHSSARLDPARAALARMQGAGKLEPIDLVEIEYPGFDGRKPAPTFDAFLDALALQLSTLDSRPSTLLYGTGIGGLLLLALRARDAEPFPILLQGAVLWGLERRRFPFWMRLPAAGRIVRAAFRLPPVRWKFSRTYFVDPVPRHTRREFFRGYARCRGFARMFSWLRPEMLRPLEERFREKPERLRDIEAWWGGRDRVLSTEELRVTEKALGIAWPLREFPAWGHYPMIERPEEWLAEIDRRLPAR
jgi:pimeloyl-ACP methyl ester carboxylesterase